MDANPTSVADLAGAVRSDMEFHTEIRGLDWDGEVTLDSLLSSFGSTGIQASNLHQAIREVKRMRSAGAKIYLGCTSNMISSGVRESIKFIAKNRLCDVMVITAGGIEEDLIKCLGPTYLGDFNLDGKELRENGWNRIGNMVIHNKNYEHFETWFNKVLDSLISGTTEEYPVQRNRAGSGSNECFTREHPLIITPSAFIRHLGKEINNEDSVLHWCYRNNINVYSPALTDGSLGDLLTFYSRRSAFKLDIVEDIYNMNTECLSGRENGAIVLGGGLVKHHILNGNLFNGGLEYCVIINTAHEYDASDAGASLNEAYSWGKVKPERACIKVHGEASILFPLIVYAAFKSTGFK